MIRLSKWVVPFIGAMSLLSLVVVGAKPIPYEAPKGSEDCLWIKGQDDSLQLYAVDKPAPIQTTPPRTWMAKLGLSPDSRYAFTTTYSKQPVWGKNLIRAGLGAKLAQVNGESARTSRSVPDGATI